MRTAKADSEREQILDELEKYYAGKLASVRAKRGPQSTRERSRDEPLHVRINPKLKQVVLNWDEC